MSPCAPKLPSPRAAPDASPSLTYPQLSLFEFSAACEVFLRDEVPVDEPWYDLVICGEQPTVTTQYGASLNVPNGSGRGADRGSRRPAADVRAGRRPGRDARGGPPRARPRRAYRLAVHRRVRARTHRAAGRPHGRHALERLRPARRRSYPTVTLDRDVLYVDDGDILTSAGSAASIDLCLHIVHTDLGADAALRRARLMVVQPHRDGGQAQYIDTPIPTAATAEPFADTLAWMSEHLDEDLTIADLAGRTATSPRSFARHFAAATGSTPYQWLLRQRIQQAQRLLERTDLPVEQIAAKVGLGNATNLRKHFRRQLSTSPQAYRRTFTAA